MISAVVLTRDKKGINPRSLPSISFTDEVLIKICGKITDFAAARNSALRSVKGDWVLFIDSDEVVSKTLAREIKDEIWDTNKVQGYYLKRDDYFLGKWLRFGETANVQLLRLAKKNAGEWTGKVHETWQISGETKTLKNPILHYPHPTIGEFVTHINDYTDLRAAEIPNFNLWQTLIFPLAKFFHNYFLRLGFLDGYPGFVMAFMMSWHSLVVRVKQYETG